MKSLYLDPQREAINANRPSNKRWHISQCVTLSAAAQLQKDIRNLNKDLDKLQSHIASGHWRKAYSLADRIMYQSSSHRAAMRLLRQRLPGRSLKTDEQILNFPRFKPDTRRHWETYNEDTRIKAIPKKDGTYRRVFTRGPKGKVLDWLAHQIALRFRAYPDNQMRRPGKSMLDARAELIKQIEDGATSVHQVDMRDFFASIPHSYIGPATRGMPKHIRARAIPNIEDIDLSHIASPQSTAKLLLTLPEMNTQRFADVCKSPRQAEALKLAQKLKEIANDTSTPKAILEKRIHKIEEELDSEETKNRNTSHDERRSYLSDDKSSLSEDDHTHENDYGLLYSRRGEMGSAHYAAVRGSYAGTPLSGWIADGVMERVAPDMLCWADDAFAAGNLAAMREQQRRFRHNMATLPWLSAKTDKIRRARDGVDFLGLHIRKTVCGMVIQPSNLKQKLREFMEEKPPKGIHAGAQWRREMKQKIRSWRAAFPEWENGDWQIKQLECWVKRIRHDGSLKPIYSYDDL